MRKFREKMERESGVKKLERNIELKGGEKVERKSREKVE